MLCYRKTATTEALSKTDKEIDQSDITHLYRLGKYDHKSQRPRLLLVKFLRSNMVLDILSSKTKLETPIYIKPDMTQHESQKERWLLKERRSLIEQGTEQRYIKLRNDFIFVQNKFHCKVSSDGTSTEYVHDSSNLAANVPTQIMESSWLPASTNHNTAPISNLKLSIVNFCSVTNQRIQLEAFIFRNDIDILMGTESHLDETILNFEIFPNNFCIQER